MCAVSGRLVTIERSAADRITYTCRLYTLQQGSLRLTSTPLYPFSLSPCCPYGDQEGHLYLPSPHGNSLDMYRLRKGELLRMRSLTGQGFLAVPGLSGMTLVTPRTLLAGGTVRGRGAVYIVDTATDRCLGTLEPPPGTEDKEPWGMASIGDTVLVGYRDSTILALYAKGSSAPTALRVDGLVSPGAIIADSDLHFLVADTGGNQIVILTVTGEVYDTMAVDRPVGMAFIPQHNRLYVASLDGQIVAMSPKTKPKSGNHAIAIDS